MVAKAKNRVVLINILDFPRCLICFTDEKLAADISTKKMRRKFLESMKNSNPKYYSHQIQQIIPFPDKFPVANLDYGLKALQMIQTGEITRAGKIQLIDTIFHELIKYTGL